MAPNPYRLERLSDGLRLVLKEPGTWIVACLVFGVASAIAQMLSSALFGLIGLGSPLVQGDFGAIALSFGTIFAAVVTGIASQVITAFFYVGMCRMALRQVRTGKVEMSDLFTGADAFVPMLVFSIVGGIAIGVAALFLVIPGLILAGMLIPTYFLISDRRMKAFDAMQISFSRAAPFALSAGIFALLAWLFMVLGLLACCVGFLITAPAVVVAAAHVYEDMFPAESA